MDFPSGSTYVPMDQWIASTVPGRVRKVRSYPIDERVLAYIKKKRRADTLQIAEAFGIGWLKTARICKRLEEAGRIRPK